MNRLVFRSAQAEQDLFEIGFFIAQDNIRAAERVLDNLEAKMNLLARSPEIGRIRPELAPGVRSFPVDPYVIFYRTASDGIDIIRVLHGARDIKKQF